ncbi:MAG: GntR family transcriptional regulator [Planctomycetota bacterium]|nr:GntR family transcriptional regulator [Planctomycetota bacterium]
MVANIVRDPVYYQINRALRDLLKSKEFKVGDRFMTEREVSEQFRVSRATANKALSNLVAEGVLEFKKGVGTFVRGGVLDYDLQSLVSFTDKARAAGKVPSTKVLAFATVAAEQAGAEVARALAAAPGEPLYLMERLRLADGLPVILERRFVPVRFCPDLSERDVAGSLYALWTRTFKLAIDGADQQIRAVALSGERARQLGVAEGSAGLLVLSTGYLSGGEPLWWEETYYRGDAYEFRNRLGSIQTARPAAGALR